MKGNGKKVVIIIWLLTKQTAAQQKVLAVKKILKFL